MKTPEQIREWLEAQEWNDSFKLNTHCDNSRNAEKVFSGHYGKGTILLSFDWRSTKEGFLFWNEVHGKFLEWYDEEEKK